MSAERLMLGVLYAIIVCIGILIAFMLLAVVVATKGIILIPLIVIFGGGYLIAKFCLDENDY